MDYGIKKYLKLLSKKYKNIEEVSEEIINLQAILNLPKGTELFLSDLHGEYDSFCSILNNGAGIIQDKINFIFGNTLGQDDRKELANLIYNPEGKLEQIKEEKEEIAEWYQITLYRLIEVCKNITSKYTRSKVRKALPTGFDYIIEELLSIDGDAKNKDRYYKKIISSIIEIKRADAFIIALSNLIKQMAVDHLHILGDIYDRGLKPELIMDDLLKFHSIDIQWGNHDILWMGAFCGNEACIANVIRLCLRYDNLDTIEEGYGISLRELSAFALKTYCNDEATIFLPTQYEYEDYTNSDKTSISKIHKAITIIALKLEGLLIIKHPEYHMEDRLLLDKIDYNNGTIELGGKIYKLKDTNFPTINPENPYELTKEELQIISRLKTFFMRSKRLEEHINLLYNKGGIYCVYNSNLLFHGCVPTTEEGKLEKVEFMGKTLKGKELLDYIEEIVHKTYKLEDTGKSNEPEIDAMWFLWCWRKSPLFGKDKATMFERYFIEEEQTHVEVENPYYKWAEDEAFCNKILDEFNIKDSEGKIINGHVILNPKTQTPIKANGKLIIINGGLTKRYKNKTMTTRHVLTYNSYGLLLSEVQRREDLNKNNGEIEIKSQIRLKEEVKNRKIVEDTDIGRRIKEEITDLKMLLMSYREGIIKEKQ